MPSVLLPQAVVATTALLTLWAILALGLHILGVNRGWYGDYWWYDHLTHFVSGAATTFYIVQVFTDPLMAIPVFWLAATVWEVYEYQEGKPAHMWHSWRNMFYDLVFGTLGAIVVLAIA